MEEVTDHELLDRFVRRQSEDAFRELVQRHVALVYSVALRHTNNPHSAQDITQAVFIILARKAASLKPQVILSGWLYQTGRLTAVNFQRSEIHRLHREKEAFMQSRLESEPDNVWNELVPLLDEGMSQLNAADRDAIVLRFFENKSLREVARDLGVGEGAAQKRVARSIDRLHTFFMKRGVQLTTTAMIGAVSARSVQGTPTNLAVSVAAGCLSKAVATGRVQLLTQSTLRALLWPTARRLGLGVLACVLLTSSSIFYYQTLSPPTSSSVSADYILDAAGSRVVGVGYNRQPIKWLDPAARRQFFARRTNAHSIAPSVAALPVRIRIQLQGTAGLAFELVHTEGGRQHTETGVLPAEVSFLADGFSARLNVRGHGVCNLQVFRNDLRMAGASAGLITDQRTFAIDAKTGRKGVSARILPN